MKIILLILKVIILILSGMSSMQAVEQVAFGAGVSFATLWDNLPDTYK